MERQSCRTNVYDNKNNSQDTKPFFGFTQHL